MTATRTDDRTFRSRWPAVADAAVIPVPDGHAGEPTGAVVVAAGEVAAVEVLAHVAAPVAQERAGVLETAPPTLGAAVPTS